MSNEMQTVEHLAKISVCAFCLLPSEVGALVWFVIVLLLCSLTFVFSICHWYATFVLFMDCKLHSVVSLAAAVIVHW